MLHLILLQVNIGSHSKRGFAKRTLYTEASRQFQRCHQRAALSHEKKKGNEAMLCDFYVHFKKLHYIKSSAKDTA